MKPLISVIVPAYNVAPYIEKSINSIKSQSYTNIEIIIIDDGSSDNTPDIADNLAKDDERIKIIHQANKGVSAARNAGLDMAKGEYIGFVDADDMIDSDMYEFLLENAIKYKADISHCGYQMDFPNRTDYYYNTKQLLVQNSREAVDALIRADIIEPGLCNKLYKSELFNDIRLDTDIVINEDLLLNYFLFKRAEVSVFEDIAKYHYVVRKSSASTGKLTMHKLSDPLKVLQIIMENEQSNIDTLKMVEYRYLYTLEKICTSKVDSDENMIAFRQQSRTILKDILGNNKYIGTYTKRQLKQMKMAAYKPALYNAIHGIYAHIKGTDNKYKV